MKVPGIGIARGFKVVHGIHYLRDFYAALGIERDATQEEIHRAYNEKIREYHPDLVSKRGEKIRELAKSETVTINMAYKILSDSDTRESYDRKLESFPPNRITKSEVIPIDLRSTIIDVDYLVNDIPWEDKDAHIKRIENQYKQDEGFIDFLRGRYKETPSRDTKAPYLDALIKKSTYLSLLEVILWEDAGISRQGEIPDALKNWLYYDERIKQIDSVIEEIPNVVDDRISGMLEGVSPALLMGPEFSIETDMTKIDVYEIRDEVVKKAIEGFKSKTHSLKEVAKELSETFEEIYSLTDWEYFPPEQNVYNKILILLEEDDKIFSEMAMEFLPNGVELLDDFPKTGLSMENFVPENIDTLNNLIDGLKINFTLLHYEDRIETTHQINEITASHGTIGQNGEKKTRKVDFAVE